MNLKTGPIQKLMIKVEKLKNSEVKRIVKKRVEEFKKLGSKSSKEIFKELCFCILTANFNAKKSIEIQKRIDNGFLTLPESKLYEKLRKLGYRYPTIRAKYIVEARKYRRSIKKIIQSFTDKGELREWLVKNIKGIGYKEASHFLRNVGYMNFAIIDFHIVDLLVKNGIIKKPKIMNRKEYLEIERLLKSIADELSITLGELDLYLWYMETGEVLK